MGQSAAEKTTIFRALAPASGELRCEGKLHGTPCPNGARIDLRHVSSTECGAALPGLHMDHTYDVQHIARRPEVSTRNPRRAGRSTGSCGCAPARSQTAR